MTKLGNPETPAPFQESPMTRAQPTQPNFAAPPSTPSSRGLNGRGSSARSPKPLRRWSVAELVARAAVRRPRTA
jgi:hypothetical protein